MFTRIAAFVAAASFAAACSGRPETSGSAGSGAARATALRFTAIPDQNTTELQEKFRPLGSHLTQTLGVSVEYLPARDYQAAVEMFVNGDVGLAWYGGLTGVQARNKVPGARAIAQGDTDPQYFSYFIANKDTGLRESEKFPADIAKYSFTFGSEQSTSGRLMPEYFIRTNTGKSPKDFFQKPVGFSGSHDKTIELVASGQYPVGVVNYRVYDQRVAQKQTDPDVVRIIWRTPRYADYNWTARPDLDQKYGTGFTDRLAKALLDIQDPKLLAALPRERLVPASNEAYDGIRDVARQLDMLR
jgi:phosphonate transport system substrate-binding protein